ncbi:hypothetical protein B879_04113 [Cecembia lonarensis LW9]|uniref:Uncharacterized protein n=1 Tax=Cecembia lonarensis (strain CCUG 58316 / KCTC 22772 / LW9) TaxID=1225176 RepID=K1LT53_CECL9|nr:hypothetical protein B879_04113 [Cecembia lonarensis LW9]
MAVHGVKSVVSTLASGLEGNGFHDGGWFFGTLLGPEITGPDVSHVAPLCGVGAGCWVVFFLDCPAHGLSRHVTSFVGCVGGGCDGVVVWELYSGREHLVKQD